MEVKIVSWNVNGLRAAFGKGFADVYKDLNADFFCIQETKMAPYQADERFSFLKGYWNAAEKKGYSGTAVFTAKEPQGIWLGIGEADHDREGRVITLALPDFYLVNTYTPNAQRGLERLDYRMTWEDAMRAYLTALDKEKPVIVCGDMNVAHQEIDIKNAKSNRGNAGFTDEERHKMTALLASGFTDTFRMLHPDVRDAYTWWSYQPGARERNVGWRIDYVLVSDRLAHCVRDAFIMPDICGSDHCPVGVTIKI